MATRKHNFNTKHYFLILLLIAAMAFVLTACGGDAEDSDSGDADEDAYSYEVENIDNGTALGTFNSVDLGGNEVSDAIFAEKDVTILNVWGTYCGPCIREMPELAALDSQLPDNAQVIGMVIDVPEGDRDMIKTAKQICADNHVAYTNIASNDSIEELLSSVEAIPTTFILDSSGKTVCKPIVGADVDAYREAALEYLQQFE